MTIKLLPLAAVVFLSVLASPAQSAEGEQPPGDCSPATAKQNPELIEAACTFVIRRPDATRQERVEALYRRGFGRLLSRLYLAAIQDIEEGLELAPDHNLLHRQRGWIALRRGNLNKAFFHARKAIELHPRGSEEHYVLALIHLSARQFDEAIESFNNAIALKDDHIWSRYERALLRIDHQNYKDALKDTAWLMNVEATDLERHGTTRLFRKRVGLYSAIRFRHATVLVELGRLEEGEQVLNELVKSHRSAVSFLARARLLATMPFDGKTLKHRAPDALRDFRTTVELAPDYSYAWRYLALEQYSTGRHDQALAANERAIATNQYLEYAPDLIWERARILRSLNRSEEAVETGVLAMELAFRSPSTQGVVANRISNLRVHGYWQSAALPTQLNQDVIDATTACFHDPACL